MEFFVTFGQMYAREPHPAFLAAHPDGYLVVEAAGYDQARAAVVALLGQRWSDLYTSESWARTRAELGDLYPLGELGRFKAGPPEEQERPDLTEYPPADAYRRGPGYRGP
jgi:hypothetical protein